MIASVRGGASRRRGPAGGRIPKRKDLHMNNESGYSVQGSTVLVAIEPRAYAHTIGAAINELRPCLDIRIVESSDIQLQVQSLKPGLVLCSRRRTLSDDDGSVWVKYNPYAGPAEAEIRIDGTIVEKRGLSLMDLVEIVDQMIDPKTIRNGHAVATPIAGQRV